MGLKKLFGLTLKTSVDDADIFAGKDSTIVSGNPDRNYEGSVLKTYFQGLLPGRITVNEADIASLEGLRDGTTQLNPRSFTSGRFDSHELTSGGLTVTGWYTIAESSLATFRGIQSEFSIDFFGSSRRETLKISVLAHDDTAAKTHSNTTIKILDQAGAVLTSIGARLAKSDSVSGAGFKVQVFLDIVASSTLNVQIAKNLQNGNTGFTLVIPYLDNTPTLPDGVTVGTFLEAGEELSFAISLMNGVNIACRKASNDAIRCTVLWPEIPKQGTGLTITLPSTNLTIEDGAGASVNISVAHSISSLQILGNLVQFNLTEVGVFTTLNFGPTQLLWNGIGGKLTIT